MLTTGIAADEAVVPGDRAWRHRQALYWLIRMGGVAVVAPVTLARIGNGHRLFGITVLATGGVLLVMWVRARPSRAPLRWAPAVLVSFMAGWSS